ncbi:MAG: O-antigen ligase family protein [Microthrixaceae bacterium]|nr:O-antigen ligase family protein [Microthrixaceae bacterium]
MDLSWFAFPERARQRVELAVLTLILIALSTGPVYFVSKHLFGVDGSWESRPIKYGFVLTGFVGGCVWLSMALDRRIKRLNLPLVLGGIFAALAVASTTWSIIPRQTLWRGSVYVAMFLIAWALASLEFEHLWTVIFTFTGLATAASIAVVVLRPGMGIAQPSTNWNGIYTSPNSLGPIAAMFIIATIGMALLASQRWVYAISAACIAVAIVPLVKSSSETAILALLIAISITAATWFGATQWCRDDRRRAIAVWVTSALVAVVGSVVAVPFLSRTSGIKQRLDVWPIVWERILIKPLWGYGFFTYWGTGASMQPRTIGRAGSAHNSVLEAGLDLGVIGMVLVTAMIVLALWFSFRRLIREPGPRNAAVLTLAIFIVMSHMTESFISWFSYMWILLVVVASFDPEGISRNER